MKWALLLAFAVSGCSASASSIDVLASGQSPSSLTSDGVNVYWTNHGGGVMKCGVDGCGQRPTRLATAGAPAGIAVSDGDVFFTDVLAGAVSKTPIAGGETTRIGASHDAWGIALTGGRVFWTTNATRGPVMTCSQSGCAGAPANVAGGDESFAIATDGSNVYWSDWNAIWSCGVEGCATPTALAAVSGHVAIALYDAKVYWTYADQGVVLSCDKTSCAEPSVVATHQPGAAAIAADDTGVYWVTATSLARSANGEITELAPLDEPGVAVALDSKNVYVATSTRVMRVAK